MIINFTGAEKRVLSLIPRFTKLIVPAFGIFLLFACNDKNFNLGNNFLESQTHMVLIDTLSLKLSTVVMDSIATSNSGVMLLGNYKDPAGGGDMRCNGFFSIGLPSSNYNLTDFDYDSIVLALKYSGYILGDTTQDMDLSVYKTTKIIKTSSNGYIYSNDHVDHEPVPIGTKRFQPYPGIIKHVTIRLNDSLVGKPLFDSIQHHTSAMFSSNGAFEKYFSDLAVIADSNYASPILGFSTNSADLELRLYVHTTINTINVQDTIKFPLATTTTLFTQIQHDFPDTALAHNKDVRHAVPSQNTGNKTYIEGGVGLLTKIQFTGMPNLLLNTNGIILKAELEIRPDPSTYNWKPLPGKLVFYNTDAINSFNSQLMDPGNPGNPRPVTFTNDIYYHENTSYTVDITDFIVGEAADHYFDIQHGLLVSIPFSSFLTTFNRLVISARPGQTKLKIYYLFYN